MVPRGGAITRYCVALGFVSMVWLTLIYLASQVEPRGRAMRQADGRQADSP